MKGAKKGRVKISVKPAHKLNLPSLLRSSKPSKPSKPLQAPSKPAAAKMSSSSAATIVESLAVDLRAMMIDDPIMKALWEGRMRWGDIFYDPEEQERSRQRRVAREAEEAAERAQAQQELDALLAERAARDAARGYSKPRVSFSSEKPTVSAPAVLEREVPAFPAGRRTLMAKNLPRDIAVQELRSVFEKYGAIRDIYIPKNMDKSSPYFGTIKGFAKIQFLKPDDSASAFAAQYALLNIRGKNIVLEPAAEDR